MKTIKKKEKQLKMQCSKCAAEFEIWINNSKISDERKEKISQHILQYCPSCSRASDK